MAQHQQAQAFHLGGRKTWCIGKGQYVGAVLVVVGVRDLAADLVQLRGPAQLLGKLIGEGRFGADLAQQARRNPLDAVCLGGIGAKFLCQALDRARTQVGMFHVAVNQVVQNTVAQRAVGRLHALNSEQLKRGAQDAQAATDHGFAVILDAIQAQAVDRLGLDQSVTQPVQPVAGDHVARPAGGVQRVGHGADGAGRAIRHVPGVAPVQRGGLVHDGGGGNFRHLEGVGRELAVAKVAHGPGHTADPVGLHGA